MKKWLISSVMFFGVILNSEAQITLPTTKRSTTTVTTASEPVKENKVKRNMGTGIPELPTIKKEDVSNAIVPIENVNKLDEVPQALPTLPTTTTPKREAASVVVKRRQTPRAKAIIRHPKADDNEIYESAEHIPTYPGGAAALMEFIKSNLQYPEEAKAEMAEGLVQVSFVVEKDGTTSDFEVIDEHHPALEAEAVRVLQAMPKWNPGIQDGVKVRVEYTVPVKFTLPQEDPIENNKIHKIMKKLFFTAVAVLALVSCNKQMDGIQYMPFQESERSSWGLIGTDGTVLFNDEFKEMPTVVMHDRFFVKNKKGMWELYTAEEKPKQIGDEYSQAGVFIEEIAPVVEKDKQIEFIDVNGNVKFVLDKVDGKVVSSCTNFSEGVAIFKAGKMYGCINTKGEVVVDPDYIMIFPASEGKMLALEKKQEKYIQRGDFDQLTYTILSTTGEEIGSIKAKRFRITNGIFYSGALVVFDDSSNGERRIGLVDEKGDWIVKPSDKIKGIKDIQNKTFIFTDGEQQGVMDFEGKEIIRARYADIVYANANLFFAKPDKEKAGYQLINVDEKEVGKGDYLNVLPFVGTNAIVQESDDNWIFINESGEDLRLRQDIYCISNAAMGDIELQNEYFDFNSIVSSLNFTKDGFLDMNLNMGAQSIATTIEVLGEGEDAVASDPEAANYLMKSVATTRMARNSIGMTVSATFDETMATIAADSTIQFKAIKPNQIGLDIPATIALSGKSQQLVRAIINKVKSMGQVVSENENAVIVKLGDASYFVANSGSHVYVVYGLLDVSRISIDQYMNVRESIAEPIRSDIEDFGREFQEIFSDTSAINTMINALEQIGINY